MRPHGGGRRRHAVATGVPSEATVLDMNSDPSLTSCATLDKRLECSVPQFPNF